MNNNNNFNNNFNNDNNNEYEALKIGALLHDIDNSYFKKLMSDKNKENIEKIYSKNNKCINDKLDSIIKIAEILSNGELISCKEENVDKLYSIFENIVIKENGGDNEDEKDNDNKPKQNKYCYLSIPLNVSKDVFPENNNENNNNNNKNNNENNNKYIDNLESLFSQSNFNFENLYQYIQKYTWCIPSSINEDNKYPDVSLFDHSKTTCAIACCLYKNKEINNKDIEDLLKGINENNKISSKEMFSLIHGDISGVQDFIFNIITKGANKSLKGRSFYLDLLTELCANYVINELNVPIANILFCGGGHFYILAQKTNDEEIKDYERKINDILFKKFGAKLYVAIGKVNLRPIDFLIKYQNEENKIGIPYKWKESTEETSKKKLKKFSYLGDKLFEPINITDEEKLCKICKNKYSDGNYVLDDDTKLCENCASFIEITNFLKDFGDENEIDINKSKYLGTSNNEKKLKFKELSVFKEFYDLIDNKFENEKYNLPNKDGNLKIPYKIWSIGFPTDNNGIKEFAKLGEEAEKRTGTNKIAILKMDIDNLGKIITKGLGQYATISRLSTLSSMLSLFFTGYISHLINNNDKYKNSIYLTYSGGDDSLIVGSWDTIWELAKEIRKNFKEFVCDNPDITLSAGIVLVNPKFEFKKGVNLAEEELERSKDNIISINGKNIEKNSLSIFEIPISWEHIDNERKFEEHIIKAMDAHGKKRIVHLSQKVFGNLKRLKTENINNDEIKINIPYLWRMKYYLYRNYTDNKGKLYNEVSFLNDYINNLETKIKEGGLNSLKEIQFSDIIVASRISELKIKDKK